MDYFRGMSIVLIVLGHSMIGDFKYDYTVIYNFISGSAAYFVFISGFLFQWLMNANYSYQTFLVRKYRNLIVPYLVCSTPVLFYMLIWNQIPPLLGDVGRFDGTLLAFITGRHMIAYWFIPFITVIFMLTPVHLWFSVQKTAIQLLLLSVTFIVSLLLHRSIGMVNTLHNFVYFLPIFWLGIFAALHKNAMVRWAKYWWIFALLGLASLYYHSYVDLIYGSYAKPPFMFIGIDFMLVQKTAFIVTAIVLSDWFERLEMPRLVWLAHISFPIYFLHGYFIFVFYKIGLVEALVGHTGNAMMASIVHIALVFSLTIGLVVILKRTLGSRSRLLLGG